MGVDINEEAMKAGAIMSRYGVPRDEQLEVVRLLLNAGVEHCLQEQDKLRQSTEAIIAKAHMGLVH